jgi:transcriptional regulator with XRE-family HTH domain
LSQEDLASRANVSKRTIGSYENGRVPEGATVPDGYYRVADALGWTGDSIDRVLAGGDPAAARGNPAAVEHALAELLAPVFSLTDLARDAGAPPEVLTRFRVAAVELATWLRAYTASDGATLGEGVAPADAERILDALEAQNPGNSTD